MKKLFVALQLALYAIAAILVVVLGIIYKFNELSYTITLFAQMISGFLALIVVMIATINKYELKRLTCAIHAVVVSIAVVMYYLKNYLLEFEAYGILLWILYLSITIIAVIVLVILNFKLSPRKLVVKK